MTEHQLWIDTLNMAQLQGKSLADSLTLADNQQREHWPFKYINGEQTEHSKALERDKQAHKLTPFDLEQCEDALL